MTVSTIQQLDLFGPERCQALSAAEARDWCRRLARSRYENFTVLSALVPKSLRDDFAAVYAFCRWADDLGDETGDPQRSLELLAWWRRELRLCFAGSPRHPVFMALASTVRSHDLPIEPFDDLIGAFELDQSIVRYKSWDQLLAYCRLSANPVGRIVLMMCGEPRREEVFQLSDAICTGLQLTNHWQDVGRDFRDRNRIYIPQELNDIADFETRLAATIKQGYGVDQQFLGQTRAVIRRCVERTWPYYEQGQALLALVSRRTRPMVWLFATGGHSVLRMIELWNYETVLHRPRLNRMRKLFLVAQAMLAARRPHRDAEGTT